MPNVFYFTTHRSFVFSYTALSGVCISFLRWVCHTVLKCFRHLVCCVIVHWIKCILFYHTLHNSSYFAALLSIRTFIMPHDSYYIGFYSTAQIPNVHFILLNYWPNRCLLCHTTLMLTFILQHKSNKYILFYHALWFCILKSHM